MLGGLGRRRRSLKKKGAAMRERKQLNEAARKKSGQMRESE